MSHLVTTEPVHKITNGPEGPTDPQGDDWLLMFKSTFKGKFGDLKKHVKFVFQESRDRRRKKQDSFEEPRQQIGYAGSRYAPKPLNHLMNPLNPKDKTPNPKPLNP